MRASSTRPTRLHGGLPCISILYGSLVSRGLVCDPVKEEVMMSPFHIAAFLIPQTDDGAVPVPHSPTYGLSAIYRHGAQ